MRIQSTKSCLRCILLHKFCRACFLKKNLFFGALCFTKNLCLWGILFQCLILSSNFLLLEVICIQILNDYNDTIWKIQCQRKCRTTNPFSDQTWWDTDRTTPIQFQNTLLETTYVITRNINITISRLFSILLWFHTDSILLWFHTVSSRLLLNSWHSNDPEPKVPLLLLESKLHLSPASCEWWIPTPSTHHNPPIITCSHALP